MDRPGAPCPAWMVTRFEAHGGAMPFCQFMDLALHDPDHGAYGSGALQVGVGGDFVTSPSLGGDFAALLAQQVREWLDQLHAADPEVPLSLVEVGPGEGQLAFDLINALVQLAPSWLHRLSLVMVERNEGMQSRQRERLSGCTAVPIRWMSLEDLHAQPVTGVLVGHELLDAFAVERLVLRKGEPRQMSVVLTQSPQGEPWLEWSDQPLPGALQQQLLWARDVCNVPIPPPQAEEGWTTEWHSGIGPWMESAAKALKAGVLLVVDYAHEASRYYNPRRPAGTLMAYRQQIASADLLAFAGEADLTAHLCLETLIAWAQQAGFGVVGQCRQGEALLALGLGERLHALQQLPGTQLGEALTRREALLRLVDPAALGDFRWVAFGRNANSRFDLQTLRSRCFESPGFPH